MHSNYAECKKRASLVPAAAVIPALRAYIKVVAFKTPVVEIFAGHASLLVEGVVLLPCPLFVPRLPRGGLGAGAGRVCLFSFSFGFEVGEWSCALPSPSKGGWGCGGEGACMCVAGASVQMMVSGRGVEGDLGPGVPASLFSSGGGRCAGHVSLGLALSLCLCRGAVLLSPCPCMYEVSPSAVSLLGEGRGACLGCRGGEGGVGATRRCGKGACVEHFVTIKKLECLKQVLLLEHWPLYIAVWNNRQYAHLSAGHGLAVQSPPTYSVFGYFLSPSSSLVEVCEEQSDHMEASAGGGYSSSFLL